MWLWTPVIQEVELGELQVQGQGHPQLCGKLKASLGYMRIPPPPDLLHTHWEWIDRLYSPPPPSWFYLLLEVLFRLRAWLCLVVLLRIPLTCRVTVLARDGGAYNLSPWEVEAGRFANSRQAWVTWRYLNSKLFLKVHSHALLEILSSSIKLSEG